MEGLVISHANMPNLPDPVARRRTFAIISHPDAGKTTLTEKLLLYGGAIQLAGTVKGRKASRHATSDWLAIEKERGISVTRFGAAVPLPRAAWSICSTRPGMPISARTPTACSAAVDSALMVIDAAKGVEERTEKLMAVCRMRDIAGHHLHQQARPRRPLARLSCSTRSRRRSGIECAPVTWPVGMGQRPARASATYAARRSSTSTSPGRKLTRQDSTVLPKLSRIRARASAIGRGCGRRAPRRARSCFEAAAPAF